MLILTRRVGEILMIGDDIEIVICGFRDDHVRLGINAPKDVPVHRLEVYKRILEEKEQGQKKIDRKLFNEKNYR